MGVDLFFVLSGYLITGILLRKRESATYFREFYYRRFLRIFPPYYLTLIILFVFLDGGWRDHWHWYVLYLSNIRDALFGPGPSFLGPMWSLAVEEQFYLVWPLVVLLAGRKRIAGVSMALILIAPVVRVSMSFLSSTHWAAYELLPSRMDLLAAGAFIAARELEDPDFLNRCKKWVLPAIAASCTAFLSFALLDPQFRTGANSVSFNALGYSSICMLMCAVLVGTLTFDSAKKWLSLGPLVFLGKISYTAYLTHYMWILVARSATDSTLQQGVLALTLTVAWASLSWFMFEKPLLALKDLKLFNAR
jgi:peptidoglycan/LPS O-acetylase OafA/YrhL